MQIVSPVSSSLDDPREHAETLEANHMNMCKMTGKDDPKYRQVGGELKSLVKEIVLRTQTDQPDRLQDQIISSQVLG